MPSSKRGSKEGLDSDTIMIVINWNAEKYETLSYTTWPSTS